MRPRELLTAKYDREKGVVYIESNAHNGTILVHGASCRMSGISGRHVHTMVVIPEQGSIDLVAIDVVYDADYGRNVHRESMSFFLEMNGDNEKPLNLEEQWVPPANRLASLSVGDGIMFTVEIEGKLYIGAECPEDEYHSSGHYVDANLLCKYLAGKATAEQVKAAAREFKKDELLLTQKEQKELQAEVERLNTAFVGERNARQNAEQRVCVLARERGKFFSEMTALWSIATRFREAAECQWFKSKALRSAVAVLRAHRGIE